MCTVCIDNSHARTHRYAWSCTETGLMASITCYNQSAVRFVIPNRMRRDAFPPVSSKSRLIHALYAPATPLEIAPTGNYIEAAFLARSFAKKGDAVGFYPRARAFLFNTHQSEPLFPHSAPLRLLTLTSCCYTLAMEQDEFLLLCFAWTRFSIILYRQFRSPRRAFPFDV